MKAMKVTRKTGVGGEKNPQENRKYGKNVRGGAMLVIVSLCFGCIIVFCCWFVLVCIVVFVIVFVVVVVTLTFSKMFLLLILWFCFS